MAFLPNIQQVVFHCNRRYANSKLKTNQAFWFKKVEDLPINHLFEVQNASNQFGSKPAQAEQTVRLESHTSLVQYSQLIEAECPYWGRNI